MDSELVGNRCVVLVVDDNSRVQELLVAVLEQRYDVMAACDGLEACNAARRYQPALIVMDVDMPRLDGLGACRRLKADPRTARIPVILLTGSISAPVHAGWRDSGAAALLTKPFGPSDLLASARAALENPT